MKKDISKTQSKNYRLLLTALLSTALMGCGASTLKTDDSDSADDSDNSTNTTELTLSSSVMSNGGTLPTTYTCDGSGISPPLFWSGAPDDTQDYALIMHHVPGPGDSHWYWVMYDMGNEISSLAADEIQGMLGSNSVNDNNEYAPPCSQGPGEKTYTFTLYALSDSPDVSVSASVDRDTLLSAIENITLKSVELSVTFDRFAEDDEVTLNACQTIAQSVTDAGFTENVGILCDDEYAYLTSNTYPDHDLMNGITGTNEQIPVPAINYSAPIKLNPEFADVLTTIDAAVGVAVNGVPIYDYSSQGNLDIYSYDENSDTLALGQLDNCGGHAGRGDDYHYHAAPTCMLDAMDNLQDDSIIGWGYDGYPLYGNNNPDGTSISNGELDVCNGQLDDTFGYRYHTSSDAPYIIQCLVGVVNTNDLPRVAPLSGANVRAELTPPQGGVSNLVHNISEDGTRTMSYTHSGENYYVTYSPSATQENCYDFEQKTVSNGGVIESGTYCREDQGLPTGTITPDSTNNSDSNTTDETPEFVSTELDYSQYQTFKDALSDQINLGDGNNIDNYFRNSGVLVDETNNAYYAVNGVHPVNQGQYDAYYPKSIVKASMTDDSIIESYSFSSVNGHNIDMEALSFGEDNNYLYIGDEYNYIYEMDLSDGSINREWDLADIGVNTNTDKGIEAMTYSTNTGYFYVGIQESQKILTLEVSLDSGETVSQISSFSLPSGWAPSGLFAHSDGTLYVVSMSGGGTSGNQMIYRYP